MFRKCSLAAASLTLIWLTACNQSKPRSTTDVAPESSDAEKKSGTETVTVLPEDDEVPLLRATVEPTCPPYVEALPGEGKSAANASGDVLVTSRDIYTGFDGKHTFKVPTALYYIMGSETATPPSFTAVPPTVKIDDPTMVTAAFVATPPDYQPPAPYIGLRFVMLTAKKAGTTKLHFTFNGQTSTSTVHIAAYTPEQYELGKKRYMNPEQADSDRKVCSSCHGTTVVDHSPLIQGIKSDESLRLTSAFAKHCNLKSEVEVRANESYHFWHFTKEELDAIPAFMRALPPLGF